jgi:hypothetical protein
VTTAAFAYVGRERERMREEMGSLLARMTTCDSLTVPVGFRFSAWPPTLPKQRNRLTWGLTGLAVRSCCPGMSKSRALRPAPVHHSERATGGQNEQTR